MPSPSWAGTPRQRWALNRLVRLLALSATTLSFDERRLARQALRATYADCDALGVGSEADLVTRLAAGCRAPPSRDRAAAPADDETEILRPSTDS